jgi:hypothetical protein
MPQQRVGSDLGGASRRFSGGVRAELPGDESGHVAHTDTLSVLGLFPVPANNSDTGACVNAAKGREALGRVVTSILTITVVNSSS